MEKEKKVVEGNNANLEPGGKEPANQEQAPGLGQMPKEVSNPDKGSKGKDKKKAIIALLCIAIAAVVAGGIFLISFAHTKNIERKQQEQERLSIVQTDVFLPGVTIGGIDVSGMTMEEARSELLYFNTKLKNTLDVKITYQDKSYPFAPATAGITLDFEEALNQALRPVPDGDYEQVMAAAEEIKNNGKDFPIPVQWDDEKAQEYVAALAAEINQEPQNATFRMEGGEITYIADVAGVKLNEQALIETLREEFELGKSIVVQAPVEETQAEVKLADIEGKIVRRSVFETSFASSNSNRAFNVTRATNAINGVIVKPGETFSMNDTIGPRSYKNGWKPAPAIINGGADREMQAGGGVCQVSTTLYDAVVMADLEIVYRRNHSSKVDYVDPGLDATINTGTIDFTWKNNTNSDIYILASAEGKKVHIEIYGEAWPEEYNEIRLSSDYIGSIAPKEMKVTKDSSKPTGYEQIVRQGKNGSKYASYKLYYKDGEFVKKEFLANSTYNAVQGEKVVGTAAVPAVNPSVAPSTAPSIAPTPSATSPSAEPTPSTGTGTGEGEQAPGGETEQETPEGGTGQEAPEGN